MEKGAEGGQPARHEPGPPRELGPLPATYDMPGDRRPGHTSLSSRRAALLDLLAGQPEPITLAALSALTGSHPNTLREHLDALVAGGLAVRSRAPAVGRGRPAWRYHATSGERHARPNEYAGLASALAAQIERSSRDPHNDALRAGEAWGRELASGGSGAGKPEAGRACAGRSAAARAGVVALLDDLRFGPEPDARAEIVKLRRCPLLEAAHRHPGVVCAVHLGIVRGALEVYGGDPTSTDLLPFAEPGACRLEMLEAAATAR